MKKQVFSNHSTELPIFMIAKMDEKARKLFSQAHYAAKKKEEAEHVERAEVAVEAAE